MKVGDRVTDNRGQVWQLVDKFQKKQLLGWWVNESNFTFDRVRAGGAHYWNVPDAIRKHCPKTPEALWELSMKTGTN